MAPDTAAPDFETVCVCCGGRGGWWTFERRDKCSRCAGTGWEPSAVVQRIVRAASQETPSKGGPNDAH